MASVRLASGWGLWPCVLSTASNQNVAVVWIPVAGQGHHSP